MNWNDLLKNEVDTSMERENDLNKHIKRREKVIAKYRFAMLKVKSLINNTENDSTLKNKELIGIMIKIKSLMEKALNN